MCGITGIINFQKKPIQLSSVIKSMTDALSHRGPDGEGYLLSNQTEQLCAFGNQTPDSIKNSNLLYAPKVHIASLQTAFDLAFGHRRLSILDLSETGHQPMCNPNKELWITYNGEIYNYLELKDELKTLGYKFLSASDTEVILNAYHAWGSECVTKFNGMWAFVIYDIRTNKLFASRDRFGVKPFYYIFNEQVFAFASEQKALLKSGLLKPELNYAAVFDYFVFSKTEAEEEGMFRNLFELPPSTNFELNLSTKKITKWKYYTLPFLNTFEKFSAEREKSLAEQTRELLYQAVNLRLRADVPVGSCLSGGLDSSSIVLAMNSLLKNTNHKISLFTASFEDKKLDEGNWAKTIVEVTNSDWFRVYPTAEQLQNDLENLMYCQDIPIWSTSTYAQYSVMRLAKEQGIKVILDGQGGDELWAGYPHHQSVYISELLIKGKFKEANSLLQSFGNFPSNALWFLKQYFKNSGLSYIPKAAIPGIYKKYFSHLNYLSPDFYQQYKHRFEKHFDSAPKTLNELLANETTKTLLKSYLKCEDRCSMWHSVESRTPFSDDVNLIELAFQTPSVYKLHNNQSKYILREAMKQVLPESILARKDKMGYTTPNNKWIAAIYENTLPYFNTNLKDVLDVDLIHKNKKTIFGTPENPEDGQTFKFISFAVWHKIFEL